ncbi:MAG: translation initiation factor IF-3, partial [Bacteroidota bacterium]
MAQPYYRPQPFQRKKAREHRINEEIQAPKVRVSGENVESGVYDTRDAIKMAKDLEVDLVEITPGADPPVCRIIDYSKFLYEKKRKEKEMKSKQTKNVMKEIRFTPNTDDHDFEFKTKHAEKFLAEGAKVKAYV